MKLPLFETYLATITGDNTSSEVDLPKALEMSDGLRSNSIPEAQARAVLIKKLKEFQAFNSNNKNKVHKLWQTIQIIMLNSGISFLKSFFYNIEFLRVMQSHLILVEEKRMTGQISDYKELRDTLWAIYLDLKVYSEGMRIPPFTNVNRILEPLEDRNFYPPQQLVDNQETFESLQKKLEAKTPVEWIESEHCLICDTQFGLFNRKHHCRNCGGVFCNDHSSHFIPLLDLGITDDVRVCDDCFKLYDKKSSGSSGKKSRKHRSNRNSVHDSFEDDLKKAIELSLKDSENVPVVSQTPAEFHTDDEVELPEEYKNEDEDFKQVIIMSIKEDKRRERDARLALNKPHEEIVSKEPSPEPVQAEAPKEKMSNKQLNQNIADLVFKMQEKEQAESKTMDESVLKAQRLKELIDKETNELERKYQMLKDLNKQVDSNKMDFNTNLENKFTEIRNETPYEYKSEPILYKAQSPVVEEEDVNPYAKYYMNPVPEVAKPVVPHIKQEPVSYRGVENSVLTQLDGLSFGKLPQYTDTPEVEEEMEPEEAEKTEAAEKHVITKVDFPTVPLNKPPAKEIEEEEEEAPMLIEF